MTDGVAAFHTPKGYRDSAQAAFADYGAPDWV
jgi:hypothetical protein